MGISAKELRIGNLVKYRDKDLLLTVDSLGSNGFSTINQNGIQYGSDDILDYNGIDITEEWLLKLPKNVTIPSHVIYVHQLQNLFYSLCGKELEIV